MVKFFIFVGIILVVVGIFYWYGNDVYDVRFSLFVDFFWNKRVVRWLYVWFNIFRFFWNSYLYCVIFVCDFLIWGIFCFNEVYWRCGRNRMEKYFFNKISWIIFKSFVNFVIVYVCFYGVVSVFVYKEIYYVR